MLPWIRLPTGPCEMIAKNAGEWASIGEQDFGKMTLHKSRCEAACLLHQGEENGDFPCTLSIGPQEVTRTWPYIADL